MGGAVAREGGGRIIDVFALLEGFANLNEKSVKEREGRQLYYLEWSGEPHK